MGADICFWDKLPQPVIELIRRLRLLAIGYWLLAIGYWLLAIGYWLLGIVGAHSVRESLINYQRKDKKAHNGAFSVPHHP